MTIWANCIVHNEENFIWFSIMSVIDYVDKLLVWDTGSTDKTVEIIKRIQRRYPDKIKLVEIGEIDKFQYTKMRQAMLDQSHCDWILILDGDEVWWEESIKKVVNAIKKGKEDPDAVIVPFFNAVGDIYHYQSVNAGKYELLGKKGHLTIRAINRKIPGLHVEGPYGMEGYRDGVGKSVQDRDQKKMLFINSPFLHLTHLKRSSIDDHKKYKYELGLRFSNNFKYPESFSRDKPEDIPSPWERRSVLYEFISRLRYPFSCIGRKLRA